MKSTVNKFILLLVLFLTSLSFSQEITIQRGKYFVNGQQISSREVKEKLASNQQALSLFKKGKGRESIGGMLIALGTAFTIADLVKGSVSEEPYPGAITYVGVGALVLSVPILIGKNKKMREGIELYNKDLNTTGDSLDYELNLISNQNGYGIQLRF